MTRMIPKLTGLGRPHMMLPTIQKVNAVYAILHLLYELKVINNRDAMSVPSYTHGSTYYHKRKTN